MKRRPPKTKRRTLHDTGLVTTNVTILFVSLCLAITLESLCFWPGFANAYTVPKVVAALIGGTFLLPQVCLWVFRGRASPSVYRLPFLFGLQMAAISWATVNSISPAVSFWGGDWRRMGWITQFAMMSIACAAPLAISGDLGKWKRLLKIIAAIGGISALYGILQWIGWDPFLPAAVRDQIIAQFGGRYRSPGTIGQSTYFASFLLYPFFASLAVFVCEDKWTLRVGAAGTMLVIGLALGFAAAARASLLGGAMGLAVFGVWLLLLWLRSTAQSFKDAWIWIVLATLAAMGIAGNLDHRFQNLGTDSEAIGRILLWRDVANDILPNVWLVGTGPGMFRVSFAHYRPPSYGLFGPDVHWETAHNIFLDRLTEQGIAGLVAFLVMLGAFAFNIGSAIRSASDSKRSVAYAAFGAGCIAVLVSSLFNGEVIPTTYYLYLWVGLSFAARDCEAMAQPGASSTRRPLYGTNRLLVMAIAVAIALGLAWHAQRNWQSEALVREGSEAANLMDEQKLLYSAERAGQALPQVGTYHLEFVELIDTYLQTNHDVLSDASRKRLAQAGMAAAMHAVERTDKPMLALLHLIYFGSITSDARTGGWVEQLTKMDPYWFRPHELAAQLLLRQRKIDEALKEATIASELAPYVESSTNLWRQLVTARRLIDPLPEAR